MKVTGKAIKNYIIDHKIIVAALFIVIAAASYFAFFNTRKSANADTGTAQAQVTRGNIEVTVTGTGTIMPIAYEALGADITGTVRKINVKNGDKVKKGDILAEISNDDTSLNLNKGILDLNKAKVGLDDARNELTADTITAPFAGRITDLSVKNGDDVSKNETLATIQDDSQLIFNMPVDSNTAAKAKINQKVQVFLPDQGLTVSGKVLSKNKQLVSGYNGQGRAYLKVAVPTTGNLSSGTKAFGTITIGGKSVNALSVAELEWINETQIKATLSGKITSLYLQEGQVIKKGQKIAGLSSVSNSNQLKSQQLSYDQSLLTVKDLQKQMADLTVKAPYDGVISGMDINVGDEVGKNNSNSNSSSSTSSSEKTLGNIFSTDQMQVSFPVDEVDIEKVKVGQKADVAVDALPNEKYTGTVTEIAEEGTVTNNVASFNVTIVLDNKKGELKSGMTGNITIVSAKKKNVLLIPIEALQERGNSKFVFISSGDSSTQGRQRQPIKVGLTNDTYAEVTEGLKEGQKLIIPEQETSTNNRQGGMMGGPMMGGDRPNKSSKSSSSGGPKN